MIVKSWWIFKHQFWDFARFVLLNRLECPECGAIGKYFLHGGWISGSRPSGRRWLCKWCGLYVGIPFNKGEIIKRRAFVDPEFMCWRITDFYEAGKIPEDRYIPKDVQDAYLRILFKKVKERTGK